MSTYLDRNVIFERNERRKKLKLRFITFNNKCLYNDFEEKQNIEQRNKKYYEDFLRNLDLKQLFT